MITSTKTCPTVSAKRSRPLSKAMMLMLAVAPVATLFSSNAALGATQTWVGLGNTGNWKNPANWASNTVPSPTDILVFDGGNLLGTTLVPNFNNFADGTPFNGITFASTVTGPFVLSGNKVNLNGNIADNTQSIAQTIGFNLGLVGTSNVSVLAGSSLALNGVISGAGGITKSGAGLLTLTGVNTNTGNTTVSGGTLSISSDSNLGAAPASPTVGAITLNGGATLQITGNMTTTPLNANRGIALIGPTASTIAVNSFLTSNTFGIFTVNYNGAITDGGTTGALTKDSFGTLVLGGTSTYTGATTILNGTINLDFNQTGAPTNNIISSSSSLTLGGGAAGLSFISYSQILMNGSAAGTNSQTFNNTTITRSDNVVKVVSGATGTANLSLGSITDVAGGTVVFQAPTSGNISTTTSVAGTAGILGGWAKFGTANVTINLPSPFSGNVSIPQGSDFATVDGSNHIVAYTGYSDYIAKVDASDTGPIIPAGNLHGNVTSSTNFKFNGSSVTNVIIDAANANSTTDINTIAIKGSVTNTSVQVGVGNILRLGQYGSIFKQDTTSGQTMYIGNGTTGTTQDIGTLTAGPAAGGPGQIVITTNSTSLSSGTLIIETVIVDNPAGGAVTFIKTGVGSMKLDGHNTYTGGTFLLEGRVQLTGTETRSVAGTTNPTGFGTGNVTILPGAQAFPSGVTGIIPNNFFFAGFGIASENDGAFRLGNNLTLGGTLTLLGDGEIAGAGTATLAGQITGNFNLFLAATATINTHLVLANPNTTAAAVNTVSGNVSTNNWKGDTTINGGVNGNRTNIVDFGANEQIPSGLGFGNLIINGTGTSGGSTTLNLNGFNQSVNGLISNTNTGNVTNGNLGITITNNGAAISNSVLTIGGNDQTAAFGGVIQNGTLGGKISVNKIGLGTETLSGANSYTGDTNVNKGTLSITGSLNSAGNVFINTSAAGSGKLTGTGSMGAVTLAPATGLNKAVINPGAPTGGPGTLTMASLTVGAGSDLQFDLATGSFDFISVSGAVSFGGASTITPSSTSAGAFTILTAGGSITGTLPTLTSGGTTRLNYVYDPASWNPGANAANHSIIVDVTGVAATLTWTGADDNSTWDLGLASHHNWTSTAPTNPNIFFNGDSVIFDDSVATSGTTIDLQSAVQPSAITVNSTRNYIIGGSSSIGGSGGLTKNNSGSLTLATSNSFSGGVTLNAGTLNINNASALGIGAFLIAGGTIDNTSGNPIALTTAITQQWNANIVFTGSNSLDLGAGLVFMNANRTITVGANVLTVGGIISDSGGGFGISKNGAGTLVLNGANTYGGNTSINVGTIIIGDVSALGNNTNAVVTVANGATLDVGGFTSANAGTAGAGVSPVVHIIGVGSGSGAIINSSNLAQGNVFRSVALDGNATIGGTGRFDIRGGTGLTLNGFTLTKTGNNTVAVAGGSITAGNIVVNSGTFSVEADTSVDTSGGSLTFNDGTTAQFADNTGTVSRQYNLNGNVTVNNASTGSTDITISSNMVLAGNTTINSTGAAAMILNGVLSQSSTSSVTKTGAGNVILANASNSFTGGLNLNAGTLTFNSNGSLGTGPITFNGGTLKYNTSNTDDFSATHTVTFAGNATIDTTSQTVVIGSSIGGGGAGGLTLVGGQITLSGSNNYTGGTTINGSNVIVNNVNAFGSTTGNLTLVSGAQLYLNGFNVSVGALGGAGNIFPGDIANTMGAGTTVLTTNSASNSTFGSSLTDSVNSRFLKLVKAGAGTLTLTNANNYSGGTDVNGGVIQITTTSLGGGSINLGNATIQLIGTANNVSLSNNVTASSASSTFLVDSGNALTINGAIGGGGTVVKTGPGILLYGGTNNNAGGTNVLEGKLGVNGTTGIVRVQTTATTAGLLGGSGTTGAVTLMAANGSNKAIINPGDVTNAGLIQGQSVNNLNTGSLTINTGGIYQVDFNGGSADSITASGAASFVGASTINVIAPLTVGSGNFTILTATSISGIGNVSLIQPALVGRTVYTLTNDATHIYLNVNAPGAQNITWTGTADQTTWDQHTTANWNAGAQKFFDGDNVIFDDSALASAQNINLNAVVTPGSLTFSNSTARNYSITGTGSISGNIALNKSGTGTVNLGNQNTYSGGTNITGGALSASGHTIAGIGSLGSGDVTVSTGGQLNINSADGVGNIHVEWQGGNLDNTSGAPITVTNSIIQNFHQPNFTFVGSNNLNMGTGTVTFSTGITLTINGAATPTTAASILTIGGDIGGGANVIKTGPGTLMLTGTNAMTSVTVNGGTLNVNGAAALDATASSPVTINAGGALDVAGGTANQSINFGARNFIIAGDGVDPDGAGPLTPTGAIVNSSTTFTQESAFQLITLSADASGGGAGRWDLRNSGNVTGLIPTLDLVGHTFTKNGAGQVTLVSGSITPGNIVVNAGIFSMETTSQVLAAPGSTITYNDGSIGQFFNLTGNVTRDMVINGNATLQGTSGTSTVASNISLNGNLTVLGGSALVLTGNITETGGARSVNKGNAAGALTLSGTNTYTGGTSIAAGTVVMGSAAALGSSSGNLTLTGGALDLNGNSLSVGALAGTGGTISSVLAAGPLTLSIGNGNASGNYAGGIANGNATLLSVQKTGTGIENLSGNLTYTGTTSVNAGTLRFNGSYTGGGTINVASGATLGGTGSTGNSTINVAAGGFLAPGASIGNLTVASASLAGTLSIEVNDADPGIVDHLTVTGTLALNTAEVDFLVTGSLTAPVYVFANYGTLSGNPFTIVNGLPANYAIDYNYQSLKEIALVAQITGPANLTWTGANSAAWDTAATANWTAGAGNVVFHTADNVTFNDSGIAQPNVAITGSNAPTSVTVSANGNYTFSGAGKITGTTGLTKSGNGTLTISNANDYTGGTSVSGGTLVIGNVTAIGTAGNATLAVHGGGTVQLQSSLASAVSLKSLTLDGSTGNWAGKVDITNNKLIIEDSATHSTSLANLKNQAAFAAANANSAGLFATGQLLGKTVIVLDNGQEGLGSFGGVTVDANSILAMSTFPGDANLDGQVTIADLNIVVAKWQQAAIGWTHGDFNGDNQVTIADLNIVASNWQKGVGAGAGGETFAEALASIPGFGGNGGGSTGAVPEPASLALLGIGGMLLTTRRRK